jgi:restriction system protein
VILKAETKAWRAELIRNRKTRTTEEVTGEEADDEAPDWKDRLIGRLVELPPSGFERLAQRILREAGFVNVTVTGKSSDGGIDGVGVYRPSLVSFPIYFQCKRYKGAVAAGSVRDFRGAMAGRGEKGLLITTGTFTRDAQQEATRDGAPPVELIDGEQLCDLLREYGLGVTVTQRIEEDVAVEPAFFDSYESL